MATKKNVNRVDYNDAEKIKNYCENDIVECDDWKARLKQEYTELKERYEKLRKYNIKEQIRIQIEVEPTPRRWADKQEIKDSIRSRAMNEQEEVMCHYLRLLEERMTLEGINY